MVRDSILFIPFLISNAALAQTVDMLGQVSVSVKVTHSAKPGVYSFSYNLTNPRTSTGQIDWFEVDISRASGTAPLDMNGTLEGESETAIMVDMDYAEQESLVTAVGFPSHPRGWNIAISRGLRSVWSGRPTILPGESLSGFIIQSKGLPAIRTAKVEPYFDVSRWPDADLLPSAEAADSVMSLMDSVRASL